MKFIHTSYLSILVALLGALLLAPAHGFAQSNVDLVVHSVEATAVEGESSYLVNVQLSIVDGAGSPVPDIQTEFLTVTEDSQPVSIQDFVPATNQPTNIVIALDISGGMSGSAMVDAKAALDTFVNGMRPDDQVAIISFDDLPRAQVDFTTDRNVIMNRLEMIMPTAGAGRCLYDAAYMAVQMATSRPSGSRAVVLLTNGVDQTPNGAICSVHNADDVINLASQGRTPVYTLAIGDEADAKILKRISDLTAGFHLATARSNKLANVFQLLSSQLRSRYILTYQSLGDPGTHILNIQVNYFGAQDFDTRQFVLPALPPLVEFTSPSDGNFVGDQLKVEVSVIPRGQPVERLAIVFNDAEVNSFTVPPYEMDLDLQPYASGRFVLAAVAYGANNEPLASSSMIINRSESPTVPATIPSQPETSLPETSPRQSFQPVVLLGIGVGALGIAVITILILKIVRLPGSDQVEEQEHYQFPAQQVVGDSNADRARENWAVDNDVLGTLTVLESDDPSMIDQPFDIYTGTTSLGRSIDNNISFPNDKPVSRRHAEIFEEDGTLLLKQVMANNAAGEQVLPRFGTFVNNTPLTVEVYPLHQGDLIVLGRRLRLRLDMYEKKKLSSEELTNDDI